MGSESLKQQQVPGARDHLAGPVPDHCMVGAVGWPFGSQCSRDTLGCNWGANQHLLFPFSPCPSSSGWLGRASQDALDPLRSGQPQHSPLSLCCFCEKTLGSSSCVPLSLPHLPHRRKKSGTLPRRSLRNTTLCTAEQRSPAIPICVQLSEYLLLTCK